MPGKPRRRGERRTYRIEGAWVLLFAGVVFGVAAARAETVESRVGLVAVAAAFVWVFLGCRLTVDDDGLVVQNIGRPHRVAWDDVRRHSMAPRWRNEVLILELKDRSVLRAWAVSVGVRAGTMERCREVIADIEDRRRRHRRR